MSANPDLTIASNSSSNDWHLQCIALIKQFEGCRLTAYRDVAGYLTIGWGSTGGVREGQVVSQEQADDMLDDDMSAAGEQVDSLVTVPINPNQKAALVDFVFNLGAGRFRDSTLLRLLNQGNYQGASAQFGFWVLSGGEPLPGLVKRRAAERALFDGT
jgi:lysozyme